MSCGPLVLDTGPLLTFAALDFLDEIRAPKGIRDELLGDIRERPLDEVRQERYRELLKVHDPLYSTGHAFLEALTLREFSKLEKYRERFLPVAIRLFRRRVREVQVPLLAVTTGEFEAQVIRLGLTDAGLMWVAHKHRAILLTDDRRMFKLSRPARDSPFAS